MMERPVEISLTAFRPRSRPQIYTDETQMRRVIGLKSVNIRVDPWPGSNLDCAFKDKFGRTAERDVAKCVIAPFKSDTKFVSATRNYCNR